MKFESLAPDLSLLYIKAKRSFKECISNKDNEFLKDEINIPLEDIIVIEENIKIIFTQKGFNHYLIEVSLLLFDTNKEIGKYIYSENEKQEDIEDSLVFY
ncbi:hypothetical protein JGH11_15655 [Dysgonomonas sp. Marseille-P4677]|uniref:hypothetical protein n=1 Tax=Dysgonomonas sp. Marseille-P4677 TaxID=2364790 RepID=UPI001914A0D1|nr:hypothetical protein [Dysgonomonas sp. Marseille-P4677]MBK5722310.1 hypothetical protein [Dysgonomonas sp. Marseille-P4677]